jgi:proline iminopeptidase
MNGTKNCLMLFASLWLLMFISACGEVKNETSPNEFLLDNSEGIKTGGIRMIPIETPKGTFNVWTKRIGNSPVMKLLLLNGGPGMTHEYFECMESFLPAQSIEIIYYDQLGCGNSDNPADSAFWDLDRYVEEVEQVRQALNLTKDNFYLLGHSWGGILALQYALKYQANMKGLIISNMMSDVPAYGKYAQEVLAKQMDSAVLTQVREIEAKGDYANPKYMELLIPEFYEKHILRLPSAQWPEPFNRAFSKLNQSLYITMQGPSEFGVAGRLINWTVQERLKEIAVPTLVIGATHDTMDPEHMKKMSEWVQNGTYLLCPNGSHMAMYDDQEVYMKGLIEFIQKVNAGKAKD